MKEYTASNGYTIGSSPGLIYIRNRADELRHTLGGYPVEALREFFQHERDEELGRWRWPYNPDFVVYPPEGDDIVRVIDERGGFGVRKERAGLIEAEEPIHPRHHAAAIAYFEAHPERKPWEDAKPGEVWEITFSEEGGGGPDAWIVHRSMTFRNPEFVSKVPLNDPTITTARRIWPEDENA